MLNQWSTLLIPNQDNQTTVKSDGSLYKSKTVHIYHKMLLKAVRGQVVVKMLLHYQPKSHNDAAEEQASYQLRHSRFAVVDKINFCIDRGRKHNN